MAGLQFGGYRLTQRCNVFISVCIFARNCLWYSVNSGFMVRISVQYSFFLILFSSSKIRITTPVLVYFRLALFPAIITTAGVHLTTTQKMKTFSQFKLYNKCGDVLGFSAFLKLTCTFKKKHTGIMNSVFNSSQKETMKISSVGTISTYPQYSQRSLAFFLQSRQIIGGLSIG